jgi:type IV secretory pathway VirB4 component
MNPELTRRVLFSNYHSLIQILHERGLAYEALSDEELVNLTDQEVANLVRGLRDLARTPS